jgi:hypothetical protein
MKGLFEPSEVAKRSNSNAFENNKKRKLLVGSINGIRLDDGNKLPPLGIRGQSQVKSIFTSSKFHQYR